MPGFDRTTDYSVGILWNMRNQTRTDWHRKVDEALITLLDSIGSAPAFAELARDLASSPYHFHKQFRLLTGETFHACVMRLRLEKAMHLLRTSSETITSIALECGYANGEMLAKAVKRAFGLRPLEIRGKREWHPFLPSPIGFHYSGINERRSWFYVQGDTERMETKIVQFEEKRFYGMGIVGDYWQLPEAWQRFMAYANKANIAEKGKEWMSVFPDCDPAIAQEKKRAWAGFVASSPIESAELDCVMIPSGLYAVTVHFGSGELIGPVWEKWTNEWLPSSGWECDYTRPNYEWYQNKLDNQELLITFLVTAVKRKG